MKPLFALLLVVGTVHADVSVRSTPVEASRADAVPARGADEPLVTVVEFADFECPYCAKVQETLVQLEAEYAGRMRLEYRQLPLEFHKAAMSAAEASLVAAAEGKFWRFYDTLFTRARAERLTREAVDETARVVGLDPKAYAAAMADHRYRPRVDKDVQLARESDLNATPSFVINGRHLSGAYPIERFRKIFDEECARATRLRAAGFRGRALHDALIADVAKNPELKRIKY